MVDANNVVHMDMFYMGLNSNAGVIQMKKQIRRLGDWIAEHGVEIALTIMILGILAAITLPEFIGYYG